VIIHPLPEGIDPDVHVDNHGGIIMLTPLSGAAVEWGDAHIAGSPQHEGHAGLPAYACEYRCAEDIMGAMEAAGLCFEPGDGFSQQGAEADA
jgi:hypothetical protein